MGNHTSVSLTLSAWWYDCTYMYMAAEAGHLKFYIHQKANSPTCVGLKAEFRDQFWAFGLSVRICQLISLVGIRWGGTIFVCWHAFSPNS